MKRKSGYYRVKIMYERDWQIAQWVDFRECWLICGVAKEYSDYDMSDIDEEPINPQP